MSRRKGLFSRAAKSFAKRVQKVKTSRAKKAEKAQRSHERKLAREQRRRNNRQIRKRGLLQNNRARGGISKAARAHIGTGTVSLAEAIIISRLEKQGRLQNYTHDQIKDMALRMVGGRVRSIGFIASGWIQPAKQLASRSGKAFSPSDRRGYQKLGSSVPASEYSIKPVAYIANHANAKNDHKQALITYGLPALQRAIDEEAASMVKYVEDKMRASAKRLGIRTN